MSIWTSLFTGSSGIGAYGEAISVVGDNIANVSTIGYKASRAGFEDVLGGTAANGQRVGAGVHMSGPESMFGQGSLQQTGRSLDLAIHGPGFFVVHGQHDAVNGNFFTRDGRFGWDTGGNIVNNEGLRLQGYPIDATGNPSALIGDLHVDQLVPGKASTKVDMTVRLNSSDPGTGPAFDPTNPESTSQFNTSTTVYDSLGAAHRADVYFHASGGGRFDWHALVDGKDITGGTSGVATEIATGTLTFTADGLLNSQAQTTATPLFAGANQAQSINFNFGSALTAIPPGDGSGSMQADGNPLVQAVSQDGYASGSLSEIAVSQDGTVTAKYSNAQARDVGRVALASFANEQGLERAGSQLYGESRSSGEAAIGLAGVGSRGAISGGTLEGSNVDLSNELVTLIAYQRAFQANSKTVTTADEMLSEIANLKR